MKQNKAKRKNGAVLLLVVALALVLVGSFFGGLFHTSMYGVRITEIEFETERGTLNGLLYMPKGAGANDPRPVIVTTHGYLNTKEMQDAPAIEMSRRGYIVLALDMYDHGDSRWDEPIEVGAQFGTFWIYSQFDAAAYMYGQDYTKKDENGNGYIAVSGHSMGGFSSFVAMYMDEMQSLVTGVRMIYTGIPVGADLSYASMLASPDQLNAAYGSRTVGNIGAQFDEFFFGKSEDEKSAAEKEVVGSVVQKDYVATAAGKRFLGLDASGPAGVAGQYYTITTEALELDGTPVREAQTGERIVYQPYETHPWNHFSKTTTSYLIDFYDYAFAGVTAPSQTSLASSNQIWMWKELFNCVALVGFFLLIPALIMLLLKLPFFKLATTAETQPVPGAKGIGGKVLYWVSLVFAMMVPAILFPTLMDKQAAGLGTLGIAALCVAGAGLLAAIAGFVLRGRQTTPEGKQKMFSIGIGGIATAVVAGVYWLLCANADKIAPLGKALNEPTVNQVVFWAIMNAVLVLALTVAFYYFAKKPQGAKLANYGITLNPIAIVASLCTALAAVVVGYALLFVTQAIFTVDFRIWTLAVRTFKIEHVLTTLRYIPLFFIYYFINVVALNANTRGRKLGYLIAILLNVGGLVWWLAYQYGSLFSTGVSAWPSQSLNGILLVALVPCLAIAAVYARKLYEKTNNAWLAAFLNTILFTMITCANTAMFWNFV